MSQEVEQIAAVLGLVLVVQPNQEVRIPLEQVEIGLPEDSGVQVFEDAEAQELVVRIAKHDE